MTKSLGRQHQSVEVVVEAPRGDSNAYVWDAKAKAIRLAAVELGRESAPFERGHLANSYTVENESLPVLLAISLPTFAGCLVSARVIGAIRHEANELAGVSLVAVATSDERLARVMDRDTLPVEVRTVLEVALGTGALWVGAEAAIEIARAARQRWVLAHDDGIARQALPAWQMQEADFGHPETEQGTVRFSAAEARLYTVPLRFQAYIGALLAQHERILTWVYRPRIVRSHLGIFGRQILRQGLLVITDEQFLWVRDPITPPHIVQGYGYIARMFALEQLQAVRINERRELVCLDVGVHNHQGDVEWLQIEFPASARPELAYAQRLLEGFLPRSTAKSIVRRSEIEEWRGGLIDPTASDQQSAEKTVTRLMSGLAENLQDEQVYALALIPDWAGAGLLAITSRHLYFASDKNADSVQITLRSIGTVEVCSSTLGSWFRTWLPNGKGVEKWEKSFPVVFARDFGNCARVLRCLLGAPGGAVS